MRATMWPVLRTIARALCAQRGNGAALRLHRRPVASPPLTQRELAARRAHNTTAYALSHTHATRRHALARRASDGVEMVSNRQLSGDD